ncbi:hypothetical protein IPA_08515 [Ignicoccus pacificus DSM 13166]|uniref:Uncharacterized protein n=1 Tax=Ignicoccus pacificus DSM 13166 TaxID=940294 RepID=A0A977KBX5_9CREN|nr:hypothetical protein IPA_08515 [Ignicoccus pacificus DSM 13166]
MPPIGMARRAVARISARRGAFKAFMFLPSLGV